MPTATTISPSVQIRASKSTNLLVACNFSDTKGLATGSRLANGLLPANPTTPAGKPSKLPLPAGWLIGERSVDGRPGETKHYFAWGMDRMSLDDIVELAHSRWIIERFYQEAKGEVGLDGYEGRLCSGFHRHVALCMLAHCYLALHQNYGSTITQRLQSGQGNDHRPTEAPGPARGSPRGPSESGVDQATGTLAAGLSMGRRLEVGA